MLQNDPLRLLPFHSAAEPDPAFQFDANPDPALHFDADPVPASQNDADSDPDLASQKRCGSGSAALELYVYVNIPTEKKKNSLWKLLHIERLQQRLG